MESGIRLEHIRKRYVTPKKGYARGAEDVSFEVAEGRMFALLGPSGCGKTTTLRCIAGLERPDAGEMTMAGQTMFSAASGVFMATSKRPIGMVFQSYALWPHMSVSENVAWALGGMAPKLSRAQVQSRVEEALDLVQLASLAGRAATDLSGGQQQRVALARAIVRQPKVLLLDEPLSNLDAKLRGQMRTEIRNLQSKLGVTCVFVTHDQTEALSMADHIAVMRDGVVVQTGEPREVYEHPADQFVAEFVGAANILDCTVTATGDGGDGLSVGHRRLRWSDTDLIVAATDSASEGSRISLLVRPEAIKVVRDGDSATNVFKARVESLAYFGDGIDAWFEANGTSIRARLDPSVHIDKGSVVSLRFDPTSCGALPTADPVEAGT